MPVIQEKLKEWSARRLLNGQGDEAHDGKFYYANGFDCLLASLAEAAVADGMDRKAVMKLFIRHAYEVLQKGVPFHPAASRQNADAIVKAALALHPVDLQPNAEKG